MLRSRLFIFAMGVAGGLLLAFVFTLWAMFRLPSWLVVDEPAVTADAVVVLGGGGGSRLRKGIALYDAGLTSRLLLVDIRKRAWLHILNSLCTGCDIDGKDVVFLEGSHSTAMDAELVAEYVSKHPMDRLLIVTDPYHTRRASLLFKARFRNTGMDVAVVSSGDFVGKLSPDEKWWLDKPTLQAISSEVGKILFMWVKGYGLFTD